MKSAYLLINFLTVLFPILLSFDKRVQFYKQWKYIFPGLLISSFIFLIWDYIFTVNQVWWFNNNYVIGFYLFDLPVEEILFFITVPFACIFIYECLNFYVKKDLLKPYTTLMNVLVLSFSGFMLILFHDRIYTLITFGLLAVIVLYAAGFNRKSYLSRFYLAYLISLLPFFIVNGILTSIPIVMYNNAENCAFRVGTIPLEDFFYLMALLLLNIILFEYCRSRKAQIPV